MRGVGYRFRPKIEFLIKLLQFKTAGGEDISGCTEVPGDIADLYMYGPGKEPWKLFSGDQEIWELHDVNKRTIKEKYVITKLTKIGKKNVARTAGAGTWDDQSTAKPVFVGGHETGMGHWRTLTYEYWGGDGAEEDKCYYYMNELHLSEHAIAEARSWNTDETSDEVPYYVICRVLKNEEKRCRSRPGNKKRVACTENARQDCPLPKKHHGINENKPSSSSLTGMGQILYVDGQGNYNNAGHINHANYFSGPGPNHDPSMFRVAQNRLSQEHHQFPGYYSALLHSRDYPELGNQGNWNAGGPLILPVDQGDLIDNTEINWQQYMSSGFGLVGSVRD